MGLVVDESPWDTQFNFQHHKNEEEIKRDALKSAHKVYEFEFNIRNFP